MPRLHGGARPPTENKMGTSVNGTTGAGGTTSTGDMSNDQMLQQQQQAMKESEMYTMLSNIMKEKHDAKMAAIGNMK